MKVFTLLIEDIFYHLSLRSTKCPNHLSDSRSKYAMILIISRYFDCHLMHSKIQWQMWMFVDVNSS